LQLLAVMGWPLSMQKPELGWTAAWAWAGSCFDVPSDDLLEAYLYNWVANQISAAVRLVPLGATSGQCLQLQLAPLISAQSIYLCCKDPRSIFSSGVGAGIAQLQHGGLYSKLFRS
jgi:urease accessory protein